MEAAQGFKILKMTIPQKHIDFAKGNLARIVVGENDIKNGYEVEDGDGET